MSPLLDVRALRTHFTLKRRAGASRFGPKPVLKAVDGVSFAIESGEVLALVGESGCGKSTVGRTLLKLERATGGEALFGGTDILPMSAAAFRPLRRRIQMIFQDPYASLNPRLTIEQTLAEPLRIHGLATDRAGARTRIGTLLEQVGLSSDAMHRYPHAFSGGQRQRIGIARVMVLAPDLIVADEAVSALDVSVQAQVLNLLKDLQRGSGVAMLFISHDLGVVRHIGDRVAVMYLGRIVETARTRELFERPAHPYTRLLLASIPRVDPARRGPRPEPIGEPASATAVPSGCAFHPRCPHATALCRETTPMLETTADGRAVACHHADTLPAEHAA